MTIVSIDTVAVVVSNRREALRWFRETLDLPIAYNGPAQSSSNPNVQGSLENPGHWIELGDGRPMTRLHLCELEDHRTEPGPTGITFLSNDILHDYERLRKKGVKFMNPPRQMVWGEWLCQFLDPDGNEFDLKQPVRSEKWTISHSSCKEY